MFQFRFGRVSVSQSLEMVENTMITGVISPLYMELFHANSDGAQLVAKNQF